MLSTAWVYSLQTQSKLERYLFAGTFTLHETTRKESHCGNSRLEPDRQ